MEELDQSPGLEEAHGQPDTGLTFAFSKRHGVLLDSSTEPLQLYYRPGTRVETLVEVRRHLGQEFELKPLPIEEFDTLLQRSYEHGSNQTMQVMEDLGDEWDLNRLAEQLPETEDLIESDDDAPIIRLINAIFTEAIKQQASDIHVEPYEEDVAIRVRVDGLMHEVLRPQRVLAPLLVSRIKVMAKLDIAEKRLPQDGRISLRIAGRPVDVRVSTLPTSHGERVVLRLLDKQAGRLDLEQLGMAPETEKRMDDTIRKPHGIILVTGPTGSGKTTTLYAALTRLNSTMRNIMTVEDPIEYHLTGVSQTHVNTKVDMSFARGLRAILRQDPDVVMVGEIRDLETAQIAIQASLTGHLVFSTLHTNSAVGTVTRLRDMGVEPFLLSTSILGVLAQRLVRVLCRDCRQPTAASATECAAFGWPTDQPPEIFHPKGCSNCNHTGYRGRTGIYELVTLDDTLRQLIHDNAGEPEMERHIRQSTPSIREDGIRRILAGETTVEEVLRVTREE